MADPLHRLLTFTHALSNQKSFQRTKYGNIQLNSSIYHCHNIPQ